MTTITFPPDRPSGHRGGPGPGRRALLCAIALPLLLPAIGAVAATGPADREAAAFFERQIRPLLIRHCYECHSAESKKSKGGLVLDSKEGWQKGGSRGPAIVPGRPDESLIIQAVRHEDDDLEMPPKRRLPAGEIQLLTQWVAMGAPDPRSEASRTPARAVRILAERGREFWAFRPPVDPPVPAVRECVVAPDRLDRFVLAALEAKGLQPAPPADKRTLIRRATFDLTRPAADARGDRRVPGR